MNRVLRGLSHDISVCYAKKTIHATWPILLCAPQPIFAQPRFTTPTKTLEPEAPQKDSIDTCRIRTCAPDCWEEVSREGFF